MEQRRLAVEQFLQRIGCPEMARQDKELMMVPFTHKSYAAEHREVQAHNERLEFLGDAILWGVVAALIVERYPDLSEAELTLMKIYLVKEQTLAVFARHLDLGAVLLLSNGEEKTWGRDKDVILADALEALLGYLFVTCGWDTVEKIVKTYIFTLLDTLPTLPTKSYKNLIQEYVQQRRKDLPIYEDREEQDVHGSISFVSTVWIQGVCAGAGAWTNKKTAQELAAQEAYTKLNDGQLII